MQPLSMYAKQPDIQKNGYPYFKEDSIAMPFETALKFIFARPYGHPWRLTLIVYFFCGHF